MRKANEWRCLPFVPMDSCKATEEAIEVNLGLILTLELSQDTKKSLNDHLQGNGRAKGLCDKGVIAIMSHMEQLICINMEHKY